MSNMSEEEKQAIEIEDSIRILRDTDLDANTIDSVDLRAYNFATKTILNLIEKQNNRLEQLEKENKKIKDNLCTECMRNIEYLLGEQNNGNEMH